MENTVHETARTDLPRREDGTIDLNAAACALLEDSLNALMDEQASELAEATGTQRNGYRERSLDTCAGTITLRVPKLRRGTYFPDDAPPLTGARGCRAPQELQNLAVSGTLVPQLGQ